MSLASLPTSSPQLHPAQSYSAAGNMSVSPLNPISFAPGSINRSSFHFPKHRLRPHTNTLLACVWESSDRGRGPWLNPVSCYRHTQGGRHPLRHVANHRPDPTNVNDVKLDQTKLYEIHDARPMWYCLN
ncbi:hypothetical protein CBL_06513 [Carabus blaptoides fortunei]